MCVNEKYHSFRLIFLFIVSCLKILSKLSINNGCHANVAWHSRMFVYVCVCLCVFVVVSEMITLILVYSQFSLGRSIYFWTWWRNKLSQSQINSQSDDIVLYAWIIAPNLSDIKISRMGMILCQMEGIPAAQTWDEAHTRTHRRTNEMRRKKIRSRRSSRIWKYWRRTWFQLNTLTIHHLTIFIFLIHPSK